MDRTRNDQITGTAQIGRFGEKVLQIQHRDLFCAEEGQWFHTGRRILRMGLPGGRQEDESIATQNVFS